MRKPNKQQRRVQGKAARRDTSHSHGSSSRQVTALDILRNTTRPQKLVLASLNTMCIFYTQHDTIFLNAGSNIMVEVGTTPNIVVTEEGVKGVVWFTTGGYDVI